MAKHRILIDGYYLGKPSGYGRFIYELCRALGNTATKFDFLVAVRAGVQQTLLTPYPNFSYHRLPDRNFALWEQWELRRFALRNHCHLIHFPYNTRSLFLFGAKTVTTVHDLTFLLQGAERDLGSRLIHFYMSTVFKLGVTRSSAIIAVSETTRRAISRLGIPSERIYNSVDSFLETPLPATPAATRPYLLHRGSYAAGHRNTGRIIQAFLSEPRLAGRYDLKILGVPDGAKHWNTAGDQPVHYLPRITDEELAALYAGSSCVVAASLLEGFCLPIIEAFGFGAPVIASNIDPMQEIAGGAALLVSPLDVRELAAAMLLVVSDQQLARDLIAKGKLRLQDFSSELMAKSLLTLYDRVLDFDPRLDSKTGFGTRRPLRRNSWRFQRGASAAYTLTDATSMPACSGIWSVGHPPPNPRSTMG